MRSTADYERDLGPKRTIRNVENFDVPHPAFGADRIGILDAIEKQLLILSRAAVGPVHANRQIGSPNSNSTPFPCDQISISRQDIVSHPPRKVGGPRIAIVAMAVLSGLAFGWLVTAIVFEFAVIQDQLSRGDTIDAVVARIIRAESNVKPNVKNKNSSALGIGQFIDETWLDMIRLYRPDLAQAHTKDEILELRRDAIIAREITLRLAERNASLLKQHGLPVTAGTVYLAHFAGGAGSIAVLSAPNNADAALVMAGADSTGKTTREQIVKANPFLDRFTVGDLKRWADRKMLGRRLEPADLVASAAENEQSARQGAR
jgi:hypothetical protein